MQKMTIDEVARLAFVSRSVVSRVLNNHPNVSDEARARVLAVVKEHNYRPSAVARSLVTDRTFEICILGPRREDDVLATGYWPLVLLGISEQCIKRGYFVSISMISGDMETELNDRILNGHVFDGFILIAREVAHLVADKLLSSKTPAVLIGHDPAYPDLNSVDVDNFDGAYQATAHLIKLGQRRIGTMMGPPEMQESVDRLNGYKQAMADAGLPVEESLMAVGAYSQKSGFDIINRWLAEDRCPPAVFCASDAKATGALLALHQAGLRVPDEVAVIGFDDLPNSQYTIPPLTTVHQPIYNKGEQAANIIIDQIEGKRKTVIHENLPAELIVRVSCGASG